MRKGFNVYNNIGYWFALYLLLVLAGFYSSYFEVFFEPKDFMIHFHFVVMMLWIAMLITQPFLIKYKKFSLHRTLGKVSYLLFPLAFLSGYIMIRQSYYRILNDPEVQTRFGVRELSQTELLRFSSSFQAIALFYLVLFAVFYILAIVNKRRSAVHARYMTASALTLLGPTVDRIIVFGLGLQSIFEVIPIETVAFLIADSVLGILLYLDYRTGRPLRTLTISLLIFLVAQILFFVIPSYDMWSDLVAAIMKPSPVLR